MIDIVLGLTDQVSGPAKSIAASMMDMTSQVQGGSDAFGQFDSALSTMLPGLGVAVGAVTAVAAAFAGLVVAGASLAISASETKAKTEAMFSALAGGAEQGKAVIGMMDELGAQTGQTRAEMAPLARDLMAMGMTSLPALKQAMLASASAAALMGDQGSAAFETLTKKIEEAKQAHIGLKMADKQLAQLAATGVNVADVAAKMGLTAQQLRNQLKAGTVDAAKFGDAMQQALIEKGAGPLARVAGSLGAMWDRFKQSLTDMFAEVDPGPFLAAMKDLLGVFDSTTPSGQAMKAAVVGFFNGVFKIAAVVVPYLKSFFLNLIIWGLKAYIFLKTHWDTIKTIFKGVGVVVGIVLAAFAVALAVVLVPLLAMVAAGGALATAIVWLAGKIYDLISGAGKALMDWAASGVDMAKDFVAGIANGIVNAIPTVIAAVTHLGGAAITAIKGILGIHSPSKVMMEFGSHTSGGFAEGIKGGTAKVADAADGMGAAAAPSGAKMGGGGGAPAPAGGKGGGGKDVTVNIEPGAIVIHSQASNVSDLTEQMISLIFERVALETGL